MSRQWLKRAGFFSVRGRRLNGATFFALLLVPSFVLATETFSPLQNPELMGLIPPADTGKVVKALRHSGANWPELAKALTLVKPEYRPGMIALISTLRSVDLFSSTAEVLLQEVDYAYKARQRLPWQITKGEFEKYVLPFRISSEWFIPWRVEFYEQFRPLVKDASTAVEMAKIVNKWVKDNIQVRSCWEGRWPYAPLLTLRGRAGSQVSVTVFTVAALRSVGIPSRILRVDFFGDSPGGTTWVEFLSDHRWLPLYPHAPASLGDFGKLTREHPRAIPFVFAGRKENVTAHYTPMGTLKAVIDTNGLSQSRKSIDFSVGVFNDGSWRTVTDRIGFSFTADTTGSFQIRLGVGDYLAEAEIDKYLIFLRRFTIEEDKTTVIKIKPKRWEYTEDIYDSYR
ncbi:MAG: transglutaminase domain-containing protein [Candidatus Latescibacteria bacterium]|nr:transglutaminase domain-containing protein [Candidatus Latescibacterota bacterium]